MKIEPAMVAQPVIFDCDNTMGLRFKEVDDGLALIYLLGWPDLQLLGVTTTFGNGAVGQVFDQTQALLQEYGAGEIPVFYGAAERGDTKTAAARFLAEMAAAHPGEISLVATGPLTNLLGAFELDNRFFENLRQVVCMGGYLEPLRLGQKEVAELNFSADPLAAWTVMNAAYHLTIMSAQICLQAGFGRSDLRQVKFFDAKIRVALRNWLLAQRVVCGIKCFYLWDLLPVVYLTHPWLFESRHVILSSTVEDIEQGTLIVCEDGNRGLTNLPTRIRDEILFKTLIQETWAVAGKYEVE